MTNWGTTTNPGHGANLVRMQNEPPVDDTSDEPNTPSVDELQGRLDDIDAAMQLLQSGELDAADAAIGNLERRVGLSSD